MPSRYDAGDYPYAYQGQEKDRETGMEAFELRLWDARIGRWLTTDPAGQYHSPYLGMGNNPINGVDPDGAIWIPSVDENGNVVTYIMETNDSAETLMSQYGLSEEHANEIWNRSGRGNNGSISGDIVKHVTGSEILKLNSFSDTQKNLEQFAFAMRHDTSKDNIFKMTDYFSASKKTSASTLEVSGFLDINGSQVKVWGEFRVLSTRNASAFGCKTGGCYDVPYAYSTLGSLENREGTILGGGKNNYAIYKFNTYVHFDGKHGNNPGFKQFLYNGLTTFRNNGAILKNYLEGN